MDQKELISRVGSGVVNLIFFQFNEEDPLELIYWTPTNQAAWMWVQQFVVEQQTKAYSLCANIVVAFVLIKSEDEIELLQTTRLVPTTQHEVYFEMGLDSHGDEVRGARKIKETLSYEFREVDPEFAQSVSSHISRNWPTYMYRELKGVLG